MAAAEELSIEELWDQLQTEWNETDIKYAENIPFKNCFLLDKIRDLSNNATFKPLIARDLMKSHNDFCPEWTQNTWDIEFGQDWQKYDSNDTFNKWCKTIHQGENYEDLIHRFESILLDWSLILNLCDNEENDGYTCSWFRPPHFPSTLS